MKEKIKIQKGFVPILILIAIIVSLVVAGGIGTGMVLYKQGRLGSLTANISAVFKKTEEPTIIDSKRETEPQRVQTEEEQGVVQRNKALEYPSRECPKCPEPQPCEPKKIIKEVIKEVPVEKIVEKPIIKEVEVIKEVPVEKIVYKEVCSCPPTQPNPTDEFETARLKIEQNEIYPLITGYKDSKGGCRCSSGYNNIDCSGCPYFGNKVRVGETIRMEVSAIPSKNSPIIEYRFGVTSGKYEVIKDWSNENFAEYTVPDIAYSRFVFTVAIRNDYPRRRDSSGYDDYIQILYEVLP